MQLPGSGGVLVRRRALALCLLVVLLGSPWVQDPLRRNQPGNSTAEWLQHILTVPGWQPGLSAGHGYRTAVGWSENLGLLVLLAGVALLLPRVLLGAAPGRVRWIAALGGGVLIGALSGFVSWAVIALFGHFGIPAPSLLPGALNTSAGFGALVGAAAGALFSQPLSGSGALPRPRPPRERSTGMADPQHPAPIALGSVPGDVTRYLCAAAYLDPVFARLVVDDLLGDEFGAVAPSPGVDLVPVARHSLTARLLRYERDRRLAAVFLVLLLAAPLWLPIGSVGLALLGTASRANPRNRATRGHDRADTTTALWRVGGTAVVLLVAGVLIGLGLGALPLPWPVQWLCGSYLYGIPALLITVTGLTLSFVIVLRHELDTDARVRSSLRRPVFAPEAVPKPSPVASWIADRIEAVAEAQQGNVTVYSGYTPFIGFAKAVSSWSVSIPILPAAPQPGQKRGAVKEFDTWEVVTAVRERLAGLAHAASDHAPGLAGLQLEDRVFVNGATLKGDSRFLDDIRLTPASRLSPDEIRDIALHPDGTVRHYLAAHLSLWGGDVVPTMFMHLATNGKTLSIHGGTHTLSPVHRLYHAVDALPSWSSDERRRELQLTALRLTSRTLFGAPRAFREHAESEKRRTRRLLQEHRANQDDPGFDYGARMSIREAALAPEYQNYFQVVDATRALAALDRHTLAAVRDFLEAHGVDTTDFRTQQQTILNNGVLQQGGISMVGNQAVGTGAVAAQGGPHSDS